MDSTKSNAKKKPKPQYQGHIIIWTQMFTFIFGWTVPKSKNCSNPYS